MQEIVFFGISGVEVASIFFANGLINSFLIFICNKSQDDGGGEFLRNYRSRYIVFTIFQGIIQIFFNNYRDVNFLVFLLLHSCLSWLFFCCLVIFLFGNF